MSLPQGEILNLLHIIELSNKWPTLRGIHDKAMKELAAHSKAASDQLAKEKADEERAAQIKQADVEAKEKARAAQEERANTVKPRPAPEPVKVPTPADPTIDRSGLAKLQQEESEDE